MTQALLTVRYRLTGNPAAFRKGMEGAAPVLTSADGLLWKIWGLDIDGHRGLSVYLFDSAAAASRFATGPIIDRLRQRPDIADVSLDVAPVDHDLSMLTGAGPVLALRAATARPLEPATA